jgi:hypothetical protein
MMGRTIRFSEALAEGIDESTLNYALEFGRHYDERGEVFLLASDLDEVLALFALEGPTPNFVQIIR